MRRPEPIGLGGRHVRLGPLDRVALKTPGRNLQSQAAIERIGGVREGTLRSHMRMPDGFIRDSVYYSILATSGP